MPDSAAFWDPSLQNLGITVQQEISDCKHSKLALEDWTLLIWPRTK